MQTVLLLINVNKLLYNILFNVYSYFVDFKQINLKREVKPVRFQGRKRI